MKQDLSGMSTLRILPTYPAGHLAYGLLVTVLRTLVVIGTEGTSVSFFSV